MFQNKLFNLRPKYNENSNATYEKKMTQNKLFNLRDKYVVSGNNEKESSTAYDRLKAKGYILENKSQDTNIPQKQTPISTPTPTKDYTTLSQPMPKFADNRNISKSTITPSLGQRAFVADQQKMKDIADGQRAFVESWGASTTLGALPFIQSKLDPKGYEEYKKNKEAHPNYSMGGDLAGYLNPGMAINKIGVKIGAKALKNPVIDATLKKVLPNTDIIGKIAKMGLIGGAEGVAMGGVSGAFEGAAENKSIPMTALERAGEFGMYGLGLGGLGGAIGGTAQAIKGQRIFKEGLENIQTSISEYKFPQIREQPIPIPTKSKTPTLKSESQLYQRTAPIEPIKPVRSEFEARKKYKQAVRQYDKQVEIYEVQSKMYDIASGKTENPLLLPSPTGQILKRIEPNKFEMPYTIESKIVKGATIEKKPMTLKPEEPNLGEYEKRIHEFTSKGDMTKSDLLKLKAELNAENGKIFTEQMDFLNSKNSRGNKPTQGNLVKDELGNVVNRKGRSSNNELWYQEWSKENRVWNDAKKDWDYRKPTKVELKELAEKQLTLEGARTVHGKMPINDVYVHNQNTIKAIDSYISKVESGQIKTTPEMTNVIRRTPTETVVTKKVSNSLRGRLEELKKAKDPYYVEKQFRTETIGDTVRPIRPTEPTKAINPITPTIVEPIKTTTITSQPKLQPQANPNTIANDLKPVNQQNNVSSPLKETTPLETQQQPINHFRESTNMIEATPPSKFDQIKTVDDLPNDAPSLEAYIKDIETKQANGYKMIDFDLRLFSEAKARLRKLTEFYTNTIERAKEIPDHIKAEIDPADFEIVSEKVADWESTAKMTVADDMAKVEKMIRESESLDGGVKGHQSAEIMRKLIEEGNTSKVINWLKLVASKITPLAKGLKSIDSAFPKTSKEYKLLKTQQAVNKATDDILESNPNIKNAFKNDTKESDKLIQQIKAEQQTAIDNMKETIDALREQNIKLINDAKVPKGTKELPPKEPKIAGETSFLQILQQKISNAFQPKTPQETGAIRNMINDLFGESKGKIPYPKPLPKPDESIKTLANSYKLRQYAGEIRTKAIGLLKKEFKGNNDILKMLDDYAESGLNPPHSAKLLNDIMSKRLGGLNTTPTVATTTSNKPQLSAWVKDWYATGRASREDFVESLIRETGLTGDEANALKNLVESKLHVATKQTKDRLLELAMKPPSTKGIVKNATTKLKELINIGMFENQKFTAQIGTKMQPILKQLLKENNIELNELVRRVATTQQGERAKIIRDVFKNTAVDDVNANKVIEFIGREFDNLAEKTRNKIIKGILEPSNRLSSKGASEKMGEYTNLGMLDNFTTQIMPKIDNGIRTIMKDNGISMGRIVEKIVTQNKKIALMSPEERKQALNMLKLDVFKNSKVSEADMSKLLATIESQFNLLSKQNRDNILSNLLKERTVIKKTAAESLREKINLGIYGDELDAALTSAVKEKYNLPDLTNDDIKFITETMDSVKGLDERSEAFLEGMAKVDSLISNKTTSSLAEKVGNWNMMSMLGNASSQVTNVGGNLLRFGAYVGLNPLRRGVDKMLGGQRIAGKIDFGEMVKGFKQGFRGTERDMLGGKSLKDIKSIRELHESLANPINTNPNNIKNGKFETGYKIPFKSKPLRIGSNLVSSALTAGDRPFEQAYRNNLIKTLKKNQGVSEITPEIQKAADDIAADLTFKGDNILSKGALGVRGAGDKLIKSLGIDPANTKGIKNILYNFPQIVSQSLLPFAKTPANLAMTALDFSPIGLIRGGGKLLVNKNNMTLAKKAQIVESLTSGIAGTGLMGLGYGLKKSGNITDGKLENRTASNQQAQLGKQSDALKIGNKNIDLKKFYPLTAPIVAGANLSPQSYFDSIGSVINNYTDNNLLQNVSKAAELFSNKASVDKGKVLADLGLNMASQSIPSLIKKTKYIKDDFERNTKSDSIGQYASNKIKNQLPILSESLPPKVDYKGEPIKQYGGNNTFGNVMLNPYKITEQKQDKNLEESLRLFEKFGDTSVLIPDASNTNEIGDIKLSVEQQNQYQKLLGQNSIMELNNIFNKKAFIDGVSYTYNDLSDEIKQEVFSKALSNARGTAKEEMKSFLGIDMKKEKLDKRIETIKNKKLYNQFGLSK